MPKRGIGGPYTARRSTWNERCEDRCVAWAKEQCPRTSCKSLTEKEPSDITGL
jgi:hypothetical protein